MTATTIVLLALILISLWIGFYQLVKQQGRILLRLDALEQNAGTAASAPTVEEADPDGLPLGTDFPAFSLPDLAGKTVALEDFRGKRPLLVHWNFECGFCDSIAPNLAALDAALAKANVAVVLLAYGDASSNQKAAAEHGLKCPVLLTEGCETLKPFDHQGTPVAYLLDEQGRVDAPFASGADRVLALARALADQRMESPQPAPASSATIHEPARHQVKLPGLAAEKGIGLGDVIKRLTSAIGIKPCVGCERRATLLNRWLSFSGATVTGDGLKSGERAPVFSLPDLQGHKVALEEFRGRRVLLVFSDPQCGPCDELAPDLVRVHREHENNGLAVVLIGRGNVEENRRKAEQHGFRFPVVIQPKWKLSKEYGILATPVAFLIGEDGVIAKDVAVGRDAVLALARDGLGAKGGENGRSI